MADLLDRDDVPFEKWLRPLVVCDHPRTRLICLPHAGGSASFFGSWARSVPDGVALLAACYPGREARIAEPFAEAMDDLVTPLAALCARLADAPLALFGHSMGASIGYEVALRLQREYGIVVSGLFVSSRSAPGHVRTRAEQPDDAALIDELMEMGVTAAEALLDADMRDLVLPAVRADYRLLRSYDRQGASEAIEAPIVAYYGLEDDDVDEQSVAPWAELTRSQFTQLAMPGGHFYLQNDISALVGDLSRRLGLPTPAGTAAG